MSVILAKLVAELLKSRLINSRLNLEIGEIAWRYFLVDHVTWRPRNIDWQVHLWDFLAREIVCASRKRNENCDEKKREGGRDRFEILLCELARNISFWRNKIWKSNFFPELEIESKMYDAISMYFTRILLQRGRIFLKFRLNSLKSEIIE